jgi:hypothetical protein
MTNKFLVSTSPCLGRLKSFFATRTPSVVTVCQPILIMQHEAAKCVYCAIAMAREVNTNLGRGTCNYIISIGLFQLCIGTMGEAHVQVVRFPAKFHISIALSLGSLESTDSWIFLRSALGMSIVTVVQWLDAAVSVSWGGRW